jgi:hypothetical protein
MPAQINDRSSLFALGINDKCDTTHD